uniref:Uncharacterized protein n=1 Tax=Palpitomonas bilix TaxID=652834 RepID=A0A7S3DAN1_9EUKA|mmetsp:Transcript_29572/g.76386  ORF Transcript_29572/g.76386 Transcript_29572/m.76386 type:complete len:195 (+) Transcript_29572:186-770(+)
MPKDNERGGASKALYITFFFTGLGYLFPFNVLVSDIDFLKESYPSLNLEFIISIAYNIPCVFVLLLLVKFGDRLSFSGRIYTAFGVDLAVLAALAGLRFISISPPLLLWSTVAASIVTGCAAAVVDGTLFGLASKFPSSCVQAVMAAIPLSGTVTGLQKIIIKLVIVSINGGEGEVSEATIETGKQLVTPTQQP